MTICGRIVQRSDNMMLDYKLYSRVSCFKGIDERSFALNTKAKPDLFLRQFDLCERLIKTGFDLYGYITLTAEVSTDLIRRYRDFLICSNKNMKCFPFELSS